MSLKKIVFFVFIIISLVIINNLVHSIYNLWQKQQLVVSARRELEKEKDQNKRYRDTLTSVNTTQFVEQEARNKLFLAKPGEKIIVMPSEALEASQSGVTATPDVRANWEKWWSLFF